MSKGIFPDIWKEANVSLLFKKDDPSSVSNYRPISLLNTIGKVMEKNVHKHMFNFILDQHAITSLQSGFVPGDSTVNQLVDIYNTFCKALDDGKEVRAIFCDVSKAFDRVGIKAYCTNSNIKVSTKHYYTGLLVIYLIGNKELLFLVHAPNGLLLQLVFHKA